MLSSLFHSYIVLDMKQTNELYQYVRRLANQFSLATSHNKKKNKQTIPNSIETNERISFMQ